MQRIMLIVALMAFAAGDIALAQGQALSKFAKTAGQVAKVTDPLTGVWRVDPSQDTSFGKPLTKPMGQSDEWVMVTPLGANGIMVDAEVTNADGTRTTERYSGQFDGKPTPVTGDGAAVTITMTRQDRYNMDRISRDKDGKITVARHMQVAKDSLSRTVHSVSYDANGGVKRDSMSYFYRQ